MQTQLSSLIFHYFPIKAFRNYKNGGFYKRGCQGKTLLPGRTSRCFLGVQPCVGRPTTCARHTLDGFARLGQNRRRLAKRRQGGWPTLSLISNLEGAPSLCLRPVQTQG